MTIKRSHLSFMSLSFDQREWSSTMCLRSRSGSVLRRDRSRSISFTDYTVVVRKIDVYIRNKCKCHSAQWRSAVRCVHHHNFFFLCHERKGNQKCNAKCRDARAHSRFAATPIIIIISSTRHRDWRGMIDCLPKIFQSAHGRCGY